MSELSTNNKNGEITSINSDGCAEEIGNGTTYGNEERSLEASESDSLPYTCLGDQNSGAGPNVKFAIARQRHAVTCGSCGGEVPANERAFRRYGPSPLCLCMSCYGDWRSELEQREAKAEQLRNMILAELGSGPRTERQLTSRFGAEHKSIIQRMIGKGTPIEITRIGEGRTKNVIYTLHEGPLQGCSTEVDVLVDKVVGVMQHDNAVANLALLLSQNGLRVEREQGNSSWLGFLQPELRCRKDGGEWRRFAVVISTRKVITAADISLDPTDPELYIVRVSPYNIKCATVAELNEGGELSDHSSNLMGDRYELGLDRELTMAVCDQIRRMAFSTYLFAEAGMSVPAA